MSALTQVWLVARREIRERARSRAFQISLAVMVLVVAAVIILPAVLGSSDDTKDVGLAGATPPALGPALAAQGQAVGVEVQLHEYDSVAAAEQAVRDGDVDVLVVDGRQLEWRRRADEQLRAIVTGAIQLVAVQEAAAAAGITPGQLAAVTAAVPVENVELGQVEGRGPDDEMAAMVVNVVLLLVIATFGNLVLAGVVEEKTSRVVEVLLARIPARTLLAGKVAGIGLLGLAQVGVTAIAALIAKAAVDSLDIPAASGTVIAWAVVWFVLGYALYAMLYGALGSLASRAEDAQGAAGPVTVVLIAGYWIAFAAIGSPDSTWAIIVSFFPPTAPFTMPMRIAMGATTWWEPFASAVLTIATVAALVRLGGRLYASAILHSGPTLKLRDAWRASAPSTPAGAR